MLEKLISHEFLGEEEQEYTLQENVENLFQGNKEERRGIGIQEHVDWQGIDFWCCKELYNSCLYTR